MRSAVVLGFLACAVATAIAQVKPTSYKGIDITPIKVERATNAALVDCPPGTNTQRGNARDGEEFAVVTLGFKVSPAFKETLLKKPVLTDSAGKTYQTSVAFVDPGSKPDYQCAFPFRVPAGTKVASVAIDTAIINVTAFDK